MYSEERNNRVYVRGVVASQPVFSHEVFSEGFYEQFITVKRLSGQCDTIPITVSERLLATNDFSVGSTVTLLGQFRSYNKQDDGKSKLLLTLFVRKVLKNDESKNPNLIALVGYVCKPPVYRTTPFNREIADLLLAVNRSYNKSDYIPSIAWGRNARFCGALSVGEKIAVVGRIQSREYVKKLSETETETKTAFEISLSKIAAGEDNIADFAELNELDGLENDCAIFCNKPFADDVISGVVE